MLAKLFFSVFPIYDDNCGSLDSQEGAAHGTEDQEEGEAAAALRASSHHPAPADGTPAGWTSQERGAIQDNCPITEAAGHAGARLVQVTLEIKWDKEWSLCK